MAQGATFIQIECRLAFKCIILEKVWPSQPDRQRWQGAPAVAAVGSRMADDGY